MADKWEDILNRISVRKLAATLMLLVPMAAFAGPPLPPRTIDDVVQQLRTARLDETELRAARAMLDAAIPAGLNQKELAAVHRDRGRAAEILGLTDRYLAEYRAAWAAAKAWGGEIDLQLSVEVTAAEAHSGNLLSAIAIMDERAKSAVGAGGRLASHAFLAENKARHGDLAAAQQHLELAESAFFGLRNSPSRGMRGLTWDANIERTRGGVAWGSGKYAEAEAHFRKAADLRERDLPLNLTRLAGGFETSTQKIMVGAMLVARKAQADMAAAQGRLVDAEILYRDILRRALAEYGAGSPLTFIHAEGMTHVLVEQDRLRDAEKLSRAVIDILEKQGAAPESRMITGARQSLASVYVMQGRWREALAEYEAIRGALAKDSELQRRLGQGNEDWALTLVRLERAAEAVAMLEGLIANRAARLAPEDRSLAEARAFLGLALAAVGRPQEALAQFRTALPLLLAGGGDGGAEGDEGATAASRRRVVVLEAYLDLLHDLQRGNSAPAGFDLVGEAFRAADVARGSSVQKALAASAARTAIRDPQLAVLAREEQDLGHRLATLKETLSRLQSAPAEQRLDKIVADIRRDIPLLRQQRAERRQRIARDFPDYAQLVDPQPVTPAEAQRLLKPDEALIALYVGERRTYLWAMRPGGPPVFAAAELGRAQLADRVAHLRRALDLGNSGSMADAHFDLAAAHDLYRQLLQPLTAGFAGAKSLLVIPHGPLGQLPFALLPTQPVQPSQQAPDQLAFATYRQVPWLVRDAAITQLPSVSTLVALRRGGASQPAERAAFLGFGDPLFNSRHAGDSAAQSLRLASRTLSVRNGPGQRSAESATIADLARLPDTAAEVREIAAVLKADPTQDIRLAKAASESAVKQADLSRYRVLVFATHGLIPGDLNGLNQPALALSNPELTGETDVDGLLTMEEVLGLKLNADWVVLSACNTAAGEGAAAEAVSGLGRAFFYAGSRALLVTNWPVETVSARLLTTELFRRQAESPGLTRAAALRQAMLVVMDKNALDEKTGLPDYAYAHPLFWAPFSLVGDGAGR